MESSIIFAGSVVSGVASLILILQVLGVDLRIFGRSPKVKSTRPTDKQIIASKAILGWLLALTLLSIVCSGIGWYQHYHDFHFSPDGHDLEQVSGLRFENEIVDIDGKKFVNCHFVNVKLRFNGTAPFQFNHNQFEGILSFTSSNQAISATFLLLEGMGAMRVPMYDKNGNPPSNIDRPPDNTKPPHLSEQ